MASTKQIMDRVCQFS